MSSALRSIVLGCVSDGERRHHQRSLPWFGNQHCRHSKVKFGVSLAEAFRDDVIPHQLIDILVYIGREGIGTTDLFRRPGSQADLKVIMKKLSEGQEIALNDYNFYTLASVIKKFLLRIPGGIFGPEVETQLIETLEMVDHLKQLKAIHSIISSLAPSVQQLLALLFGTWFWVVNHSDCKSRSSESVAKSIAGSLFHTCSDDPEKVYSAVRILEILINNFGTDDTFGRENVKFFVDVMRSAGADDLVRRKISARTNTTQEDAMQRSVTESEFCRHLQPTTSSARASISGGSVEISLPQSMSFMTSEESLETSVHRRELNAPYNPHRKLARVSSISAPDVNQDFCFTRPTRYDSVRRRQMLRLKERSCWFLSPSTKSANSGGGAGRSFSVSPTSPARHQLSYNSSAISGNTPANSLRTGTAEVGRVSSFPSAKVIAQKISENCKDRDVSTRSLGNESTTLVQGRPVVQVRDKEVEKEWQRWKQGIVH